MYSEQLLAEQLFDNNKFKIPNKPYHFDDWITREIYQVKDLIKNDGSFMTLQEMQEKYNFAPHPLDLYGCISTIKKISKSTKNYYSNQNTEYIQNPLLPSLNNTSWNLAWCCHSHNQSNITLVHMRRHIISVKKNQDAQLSSKLNALLLNGPKGSKHIYKELVNVKEIPNAWRAMFGKEN